MEGMKVAAGTRVAGPAGWVEPEGGAGGGSLILMISK